MAPEWPLHERSGRSSRFNTLCWSSVIFSRARKIKDIPSPRPLRFLHLWASPTFSTKNPSWCVQTLHFFNCYHHPSNNMLHAFIFQQGGGDSAPSVLRSQSLWIHTTLVFFFFSPQKEPFARTGTPHIPSRHCWCPNRRSASPFASRCRCLTVVAQSFFAPFLGKIGWIPIPVPSVCARTANRGRQPAA